MSSPTITNLETSDYRELVGSFRDAQSRIREQVGRIIVGQDDVIEHLLVTLLVGGHCLITGMPGTAKTLLVRRWPRVSDSSSSESSLRPT